MTTSIPSNTGFDQVYLAFDIHHLLAQESASISEASLFQAYGMVLKIPVEGCPAPIRYYAYPFVKELFQLLAATPGMHIAFSTSSHEVFIRPFVKQLLLQSLGEEKYAEIAGRVNICAKEQLQPQSVYSNVPGNNHYNFGPFKKDLDDIFPNAPKDQRLLIGDNERFAAPHQFENFVNVSGWFWSNAIENYQSEGFPIYFYRSYKEFEECQELVKPGKTIAFYGEKGVEDELIKIIIVYHDREGRKELKLNVEESAHVQKLVYNMMLERTALLSYKHHYREEDNTLVNQLKKLGLADFPDSASRKLILVSGPGVSEETCKKTASEGNLTLHLTDNDVIIYSSKDPISLNEIRCTELIDSLRKYWSEQTLNNRNLNRNGFNTASTLQLYEYIWDKVKDLVWKERMILQANHILLLTGAIFTAWEQSKTTKKSISEILFNWQSDQSKKFHKRTDLCLIGLAHLQKVNPLLKPMTFERYDSAAKKYPELPEDGALELEDEFVFS
jgi:hypothetical protein